MTEPKKKWMAILALDIEATGALAHNEPLSVGFAYVDKHRSFKHLIKIPGVKMPNMETGDMGSFSRTTWEWWTSSEDMRKLLFEQYDRSACPKEVRWQEVRDFVDHISIEVQAKGGLLHIVSDNPGFDIGVIDRNLVLYCPNARYEMYPLHYQPVLNPAKVGEDRRRYRSITDTGMIKWLRECNILHFEDHVAADYDGQKLAAHRADDDAMAIALLYAGFVKKYPETNQASEF